MVHAVQGHDFAPRPWVEHSAWPLSPRTSRRPTNAGPRRRSGSGLRDAAGRRAGSSGSPTATRRTLRCSAGPSGAADPAVSSRSNSAHRGRVLGRGDHVESVRVASAGRGERAVEASTFVLAAGGSRTRACSYSTRKRCLPRTPSPVAASWSTRTCSRGAIHLPDPSPLHPYCRTATRQLDVLAPADIGLTRTTPAQRRRPAAAGRRVAATMDRLTFDLYMRSEQAPNPDSRVTLGRAGRIVSVCLAGAPLAVARAGLGERRPRTAEVAPYSRAHSARAPSCHPGRGAVAMAASGSGPGTNSTWGNHHLGTTRMPPIPRRASSTPTAASMAPTTCSWPAAQCSPPGAAQSDVRDRDACTPAGRLPQRRALS